jgi:hypothetical protein
MRSWKTTLAGYVTSGASLVLALSQGGVVLPKWATITAGFVAAGGIAALGKFSKDYNVTGAIGPVAVGDPPVSPKVVTIPSKDMATK